MILLDTNVVSELMRPVVNRSVVAFVAGQPMQQMFLPSLVVAEIRYRLARLPTGARRARLEASLTAFLLQGFSTRIVPFDEACANGYARARSICEKAGRAVLGTDALVGGMALAHGATLATRNTSDFDGYGLALVNPWAAAA